MKRQTRDGWQSLPSATRFKVQICGLTNGAWRPSNHVGSLGRQCQQQASFPLHRFQILCMFSMFWLVSGQVYMQQYMDAASRSANGCCLVSYLMLVMREECCMATAGARLMMLLNCSNVHGARSSQNQNAYSSLDCVSWVAQTSVRRLI
jgi:hypothetical protein